jgi:hypothetical protein
MILPPAVYDPRFIIDLLARCVKVRPAFVSSRRGDCAKS